MAEPNNCFCGTCHIFAAAQAYQTCKPHLHMRLAAAVMHKGQGNPIFTT